MSQQHDTLTTELTTDDEMTDVPKSTTATFETTSRVVTEGINSTLNIWRYLKITSIK